MDTHNITQTFEENFTHRGELGASVSIWSEGSEFLALGGGYQDKERTLPWQLNTPVLVWSATKGLASACLLHAMEAAKVDPETRVSKLWPEFAQAGKEHVSLRMLLEHQAGLCALDTSTSVDDWDAVTRALEIQTPAWEPGSCHGYHPRTFGFLLDNTLRRMTGADSLGHYWSTVFASPMKLDFWIGVPEAVLPHVAPVFAPKGLMPKEDPFFSAFMTPGSLTSRSFASPKGLHSAGAMNTREARTASYPGFGGIGTASALAKFYAMLACGGSWNSKQYFKPETVQLLTTANTQGSDRVLCMETAFSYGFMKDPLGANGTKMRRTFGPNTSSFGHPGAGGSVAFGDPTRGIGFAYVMNQMEPGVLPNARALKLVESFYETLR